MFWKGKTPGTPDFGLIQDQLKSIPIPNKEVEVSEREGGRTLVIRVQLSYTGLHKLLSKILKLKASQKYQLDGVQLELYRRLDGKCTLEELIDDLGENHQLTFFEARGLVLQAIHLLTQRGIIVVGGNSD